MDVTKDICKFAFGQAMTLEKDGDLTAIRVSIIGYEFSVVADTAIPSADTIWIEWRPA